jgi:hypothetical protein
MKKVRLYESFHNINEAKRGTIHKAVKAGDYPATIVVIENGKVVHQEQVSTPEAVPASFNVLQKEYPKAKLHVEDKGGQTLFTENLEEAYDGNMADFKYEFPQVFADVTGNPEKAIKKIKKSGKGFEVRTATYMSEPEMEEVADALGMVLVNYEKHSNMAISVFESVVNESILHGSYYFPKAAVSSDMQPAKGETKYAVICHNTVQMGKNTMYLKGSNSKIGQNFEAHVLSVHDTEEEAHSAYIETVKYDEAGAPNHVSYAYGTLTSKGSNLPFDEIGGERKTIK